MTWPEMMSHVTPSHSQQTVPFIQVSSMEGVLNEFLKSSKTERLRPSLDYPPRKRLQQEEEEEANMKYESRTQQRM